MKNTMIKIRLRRLAGALLAMPMLAFYACQIDRLPETNSCTVSVGSEFFVTEGSDTYSMEVKSDRPWSLLALDAEPAEWCAFDTTEGPGGRTTIHLTVEANPEDADARLARFLFRAGADGMEMTLIQKGTPHLTTSPVSVSNIDEDLALLAGNLAYSNPREVNTLGFFYREAQSGEAWTFVRYEGKIGSGEYSCRLTGLRPATGYEYRAYLKTTSSEYYGEVKTFTTYPQASFVTVARIRELMAGGTAVDGGYKIEAVVVSDSVGRNVFAPAAGVVYHVADKNDPAGENMGLAVYVTDGEPLYNSGDVLEIKLTGAPFGRVAASDNDVSVRTVNVSSAKVSKIGTQTVVPGVIRAEEMSRYQSQAVTIENAQLTAPFTAEDRYPSWAGDKHMESRGYDMPFLLAVTQNAVFAAAIPQRGSGSVTGIVTESSTASVYGLMPRTAGDLALDRERFDSELSLKAVSLSGGGNMVLGEELNGYALIVTYVNGVKGTVLTAPVSATIDGNSGLTAAVLENYTLESDGIGEIRLPITGAPQSGDPITFTVTGLEAYGLSDDAAKVSVSVVVPPSDGNFKATWVLATTSSGSNSSAYGTPRDLGPLDLDNAASTLQSVSVGAFRMTGFYDGGNWKTAWGGSILQGNSPANPVTYASTTLVVPEGRSLSLHKYTMRMRGNAVSQKVVYLQYSIDGGAFKTLSSVSLDAANSNKVVTYMLFTSPELTGIPGGSTLELRIVPTAVPDAVNAAWVFDGRGDAPYLTGNLE